MDHSPPTPVPLPSPSSTLINFVALVEQLPPHLGREAVLDAVGLRLAEHLNEGDLSARIVDDLHVVIRTGAQAVQPRWKAPDFASLTAFGNPYR